MIYAITDEDSNTHELFRKIWNDVLYMIGVHQNKDGILEKLGVEKKKNVTPLNYGEIELFSLLAGLFHYFCLIFEQCNHDYVVAKELMKSNKVVNLHIQQQWRKCLKRKGLDTKMKYDKHRFLIEFFREHGVTLDQARKQLTNAFESYSSGQIELIPMKKPLRRRINKAKKKNDDNNYKLF